MSNENLLLIPKILKALKVEEAKELKEEWLIFTPLAQGSNSHSDTLRIWKMMDMQPPILQSWLCVDPAEMNYETVRWLFLLFFLLQSITFFHLFLHPSLPWAWISQLGQPLCMAGTSFMWSLAYWANFFRLFAVVYNPSTQRKDSYSSLPVDGALSIPVTFFEELVACLNA